MMVLPPAGIESQAIQETLDKADNVMSVSELCRIAGVSRSGYYRWKSAATTRAMREIRDQQDFSLILQVYNYRG